MNENNDTDEMILVEVAYALPEKQLILPVNVKAGTTVEEAIKKSGIMRSFPDIDLSKNKVGIFSKLCKLDKTLREKDRVEIYRPLIADPKAVRKQRAAEGKKMRKGAKAEQESEEKVKEKEKSSQ